jgi:solute carrier family 25 (mitochondrial carnitine/acylcarnitine transporter), member 20/29
MAFAAASSGKKLKALAETTTVMAAATTTTVDAGIASPPTAAASSTSTSSSSPSSSALRDSLAGAVAGSANLLCGYPFDIVKTTLQAAPPGTYGSPWDAARAIARGETAATLGAAAAQGAGAGRGLSSSTGFRAFFRGASAPLVGAALETGVNYACYSASLRALSRAFPSATEKKGAAEGGDGGDPRLSAPLPLVAAAAAAAGGALSFVLSPFELVKVRLQADAAAYPRLSSPKAPSSSPSSSSSSSPGPASVLRATLAAEGALGLTRGLAATAAREVPGNAIFFVTYEALRRRFYFLDEEAVLLPAQGARAPRVGIGGSALSSSSSSTLDDLDGGSDDGSERASSPPSSSSCSSSVASAAAASVAAGGVAGGLMWACVLPVDVAKTRIQLLRPGAPRASLLPTLAALAREGGARSLWAGLAPTLARAVPANAAQWLAFEVALSAWPERRGGE